MSLAAKAKPKVLHVVQGDFSVSDDPGVVMTTILGSCVATVLYDPVLRLGGMNHFLLPGVSGNDQNEVNQGIHAMEVLVNAMLKRGASKKRLEGKLFGGAQIVKGLSEVGRRNGDFARSFLSSEGIPCTAASLGGTQARRIRFWPADNRARQLLLADNSAAPPVQPKPRPVDDGNDVELF